MTSVIGIDRRCHGRETNCQPAAVPYRPMPFAFLSPDWMAAAHAIRLKYEATLPPVAVSVRMNLVVTELPFQDEPVQLHVDTSSGALGLDEGHLDGPDLTITTDWGTAKALFVERDQAAVMQAFLGGQLKIQGDLMKMMALQQAAPTDAESTAMAHEIVAITD